MWKIITINLGQQLNLNLARNCSRNHQGFTLVELMMVVTITGLLMAISLPSYTHYVQTNYQLVAQQRALFIANQLHRWRAKNLTYAEFSLTEHSSGTQELKHLIVLTDATGKHLLTDERANTQGWRILVKPNPDFKKLALSDIYYLDSLGRRCVFDDSVMVPDIASIEFCPKSW
ncbi:type IV pilin protein [Psychrobacter sanguinis]|uniref:type IV pilin protein n=1 Tax=Psychrobacter sanguinis TaxID=861445 RepID=UPI00289C91B2|nr:prepilin-type N-terminal cleavage/methylation domain-containing protein [Psychrobacter sanguinis]